MPDLPKVVPTLEFVAGVTSAEARSASRGERRGHLAGKAVSSVPDTIDKPTPEPGDNTIDPEGATIVSK